MLDYRNIKTLKDKQEPKIALYDVSLPNRHPIRDLKFGKSEVANDHIPALLKSGGNTSSTFLSLEIETPVKEANKSIGSELKLLE